MTTPNIDGKHIINSIYRGAVVTGLAICTRKLVHIIFKRAALPKLDADIYDAGMLILDVSAALAIRDVLTKQAYSLLIL
jgi:energy-converting hydrogenase Eha subunit G